MFKNYKPEIQAQKKNHQASKPFLSSLVIPTPMNRIMQIFVQDPYSKHPITLSVMPENFDGNQAWRIRFPHKFSFLLTELDGKWQTVEDIDLHPALIDEIAWALHPSVRTYNDKAARQSA